MKKKFDKKYGLIAFALFDAMVFLSFVVIDSELNRNAGTVLFVGFVYCISQAFFNLEKKQSLAWAVALGFLLEFSKLSGWPEKMGIENSPVFENLLGSQFNFDNLWLVAATCAVIWLLEFYDDDLPLKRKKFFKF